MVSGGYEFDGKTEIAPVDEHEIRSVVETIKNNDVRNIVVSGVFSPVNNTQEQKVYSANNHSFRPKSKLLLNEVGKVLRQFLLGCFRLQVSFTSFIQKLV